MNTLKELTPAQTLQKQHNVIVCARPDPSVGSTLKWLRNQCVVDMATEGIMQLHSAWLSLYTLHTHRFVILCTHAHIFTGDCGIFAMWKHIAYHIRMVTFTNQNTWNGLQVAKILLSPVTSPIPRVLIGGHNPPLSFTCCKDSTISCRFVICKTLTHTVNVKISRWKYFCYICKHHYTAKT